MDQLISEELKSARPGNWPDYVYERIEQNAKDCAPNEACGFIVQYGHFARVMLCANVHEHPTRFFAISPKDFRKAEEEYDKILAVFHSHPISPIGREGDPINKEDRSQSEAHNLPYLIHSLLTKEWVYYEPSGWMPDLVGRQWVPGVFDCWTLVRDYYKKEFKIQLPDYEYDEYWYMDHTNHLMENNFARMDFVAIHPSTVRPGDGLLFSFGTPQVCHCAIYLGDGMVLQQRTNQLSVRELLTQTMRDGIVIGLRHKKFLKPGDERTFMPEFGK